MKSVIKRIGKFLFAHVVRQRMFFILIPLYLGVIKKVQSQSGSNDNGSAAINRPVVLALHSDLFRGDLEILSNSGELTIFRVPTYWQWQLVDVFYPEEIKRKETVEFDWYSALRSNTPGPHAKQLQNFLNEFLSRLYSRLNTQCLLLPNIRHLCDFDWIVTTHTLGIPVVLLFRESLVLTQQEFDAIVSRHTRFGVLLCNHIIAHNERIAQVFRKTNLISESQISICGNLRMDRFAQRLRQTNSTVKSSNRKRVVLFYFPRNQRKFRCDEFAQVFDQSLKIFVNLAKSTPDVDFLIKPKKEHLPQYKQPSNQPDLDGLIETLWPEFRTAQNLIIDPFADVYETILSADVICGFFSSVLLEAAFAGKPVILPLFANFQTTPIGKDYPLNTYLHLFDVAKDGEQYHHLIESRLISSTVSEAVQSERAHLFTTHMSPVDGGVLERTVNVIKNSIPTTSK
jgi:hypothetical protein